MSCIYVQQCQDFILLTVCHLQGDYTVQVEFKDNSANEIIQCVEVEAELKKKSDGSFWGKRRLRN